MVLLEIMVFLIFLIFLALVIYKLINKPITDRFPVIEPISGSIERLDYKFTEIRGSGIANKRYLTAAYTDYNPIKIELDKPPFSLELFTATPTGSGRESFDPVTKKLNDAIFSPFSIGGKVHKDFIIKSKDMSAASEFCDKYEKQLKRLVQIAFSKSAFEIGVFQIPIKGELVKGYFKLSLIFVEGKEQKRIKEVIELAASIAKQEGY